MTDTDIKQDVSFEGYSERCKGGLFNTDWINVLTLWPYLLYIQKGNAKQNKQNKNQPANQKYLHLTSKINKSEFLVH